MSLQTTTAPSSGVWGAIKGALNVFSSVNKAEGVAENQNPTPIDEYTSTTPDDEIISLTSQWKDKYRKYYTDGVEASQTLSFEYWIGKQRSDEADQVQGSSMLVDNKIFEAIETFIPIATRANPDPLVQADPGELGQRLAKDIKSALVYEADRQKLRKILKGVLRDWIICRLGILKIGYDVHTNEITTTKINPKNWGGDPDGHWDEAGFFTGEWQFEKKKGSARRLKQMFPPARDVVTRVSGGKKGTKIEYVEWWYQNREVFYTMEGEVLGKFKNPHWNWDMEEKDAVTDEMGVVITPAQDFVEGKNKFKSPRAPYIGLSIFSTGIQPHDETSLVLQNVGIQDRINARQRQIDRNVEGMNNGLVVNKGFTAEQASQAASALRRGTAIRAPVDDVTKAVMRFPAPALPNDVFKTLEDLRNELRNIFGTSGSTPEGVQSQQTVRGKILVNQLDASRIGGGVTEYLEQIADSVYNYWVQIMFVHWTDPHFMVAMGATEGSEMIQIKNTDLAMLKTLDITVKEGSLIPKDPLTQRNEAIDLWSAGAIDPITFYKRLDYADPMNAAQQLIIWQMVQKGQLPPQAYLPNFQLPEQAQQMMQQQAMQQGALPQGQGTGGPAVNQLNHPGGDENVPPTAQSPEAVQLQSKQLLGSVPLQ